MDQDSSLNNSFDFNTQNGVMLLLASIRASDLSPADKNELRDLVFLYTNGGGDNSVKIALEQKLATSNIKPVAPAKKPEPPLPPRPELSFGTYRPAPVFKTPTISSQTVPKSENNIFVPPPKVEQKPAAPTTDPISANPAPVESTVPVSPVVSNPDTNSVQSNNQIPVGQPSAVTAQTIPPIQAQQDATTSPSAQPVVRPIPAASSSGNNNYLDRIREIKTAVNSKVGNPVNLVDINNVVGREYMNALLEAMKRLSGGTAGQIDVAMQRLETAYQAVEVAVADHSKLQKLEAEIEAEVSTIEPVSAFESVPEKKVSTSEIPLARTNISLPVSSAPSTPASLSSVAPAVPSPRPVSTPVSVPPTQPAPAAKMAPVYRPVAPETNAVPTTTTPSGFAASAQMPVSAPPQMTSSITQAVSLAQTPKILTPQDLPTTSSINSSVSGDPLSTREIDDGLEQLLADWTLFNKSGLFGTGPKGREHPLFKRIADLQIPLLLSGRFEGSTQEIKQSITDYMNGWRYEQGIIYEQGETFEHYLRRVIRHILDLQNKRRQA